MKKVLPINTECKIKNQLCNSGFLSILMVYENMLPWFYENYIQLYLSCHRTIRNIDVIETTLDFYGGFAIPLKYLEINSYSRQEVERYTVKDIQKIIDNEYYIYSYIDEYYTLKLQDHNSHDVIVHGYDEKEKIFYVVGYKEGYFMDYQIPYDVFMEGFQSGTEVAAKVNVSGGKDYFRCIKPLVDENTIYTFDIKIFMENFRQFVYSEHSGILNKEIYKCYHEVYEDETSVYGLNALSVLLKEIEKVYSNECQIDLKTFCTLYEHNVGIKERLDYVYNVIFGEKQNEENINALDILIQKSNKLKMQVIKYDLTPDMDVLDEIIESSYELVELERETYQHIYKELFEVVNGKQKN